PLGGGAIGDALEARDEELLRRPQRLDLDHAAVGGLERTVSGDRTRIGRERPQLDLAAHAVRGAEARDADALLVRAAHGSGQLAAGAAAGLGAEAALAASSARALRSLRGTAFSGLLRASRLAMPAASRKRMMRSDGCAPLAIHAFTFSRSSLSRSLWSFGSSGLK